MSAALSNRASLTSKYADTSIRLFCPKWASPHIHAWITDKNTKSSRLSLNTSEHRMPRYAAASNCRSDSDSVRSPHGIQSISSFTSPAESLPASHMISPLASRLTTPGISHARHHIGRGIHSTQHDMTPTP